MLLARGVGYFFYRSIIPRRKIDVNEDLSLTPSILDEDG